jgi:MATE family multidrug resistance protein
VLRCSFLPNCSTRVSNELGAGNAPAAKYAVYVVMSMSAFQATIVGILLVALRFHWGWLYSNEAEVVHYVGTMMPFLACIALFDGIQGVLSGTREQACYGHELFLK